ncbi:hypothetical protein OBBRIDRAFT_808383 [Obba rivulosa]|uniref:Uncharacterized protein n=1 Tax=Obba rivulosa TaxID=1052685 RepID=A0A8E2AHG5_9APHY|nr:hypothetical protein OBBRIDRAFT_808383 [Obba rivulosa]
MPPRKWASDEQEAFFESFVPVFREHQKAKTVHKFWPFMHTEWFASYPEWKLVFGAEAELMPDLDAVQLELYGAVIKTKKQYYTSKVQPLVRTEITERTQQGEIINDHLSIVKRLTKEMFEHESEAVKSEIRALRDAERMALANAVDDVEQEEVNATPETYQRALDDVPAVLRQLLDELAHRTGWCYTVVGGGPEPREQRAIWAISEAGHDYEKSSSDFDKETIELFISFLKKVYHGLADELVTSDELIALQHMLSPTPEREEPAFISSGLSNVNPTSVLPPPNPTLSVLHDTANVVVESASRAPNVPALNPHLHVPFETQSDAFGGSVGLPLSGTQPGNMSSSHTSLAPYVDVSHRQLQSSTWTLRPPSDAPDAMFHLGFPVSTICSTLEPSDIPDNQMTFNSSQSKTFTHMDTTDAFGFDLSASDVDDSIFTSIGSFDAFLSRFDQNAITPGPQASIPEAALDPAQMADQNAGIQTVFGSTHNLDFGVFPEVQDLVACPSTSIEGPVTSGRPKRVTKAPRRADEDISLASMALGKSSRHSLEVDKANVM